MTAPDFGPRPPLPNRRPGRPSERERIEALIGKGLTNQQIAERVGCKAATANKWRREIESEKSGGGA